MPPWRLPRLKTVLSLSCETLVFAGFIAKPLCETARARDTGTMILRFASCSVDLDRRTLVRRGNEVHVEPQVFDLIAFMAQSGGTVVSKDKLVEVVWKGLAVSDATISARISAARAALGDTGKEQSILRTIPRRGFAFVAQLAGDTPLLRYCRLLRCPMRCHWTARRLHGQPKALAHPWCGSAIGCPILRWILTAQSGAR